MKRVLIATDGSPPAQQAWNSHRTLLTVDQRHRHCRVEWRSFRRTSLGPTNRSDSMTTSTTQSLGSG